MDKYIRVKNCNCISDATIEIVEKSLNIKYGSNGTGKSTISEAIYAQANNETDRLKDFKPYGSNDNSQPTVDNPYFHVVKVFNEDYVNSYLFQGDEFLDDSFQVFLKSDKCDSLAAQIERMLEELQDLINNIDAIHNLRTFLPQYTAAVKASDVVYVSPYEHNAVARTLHLMTKKHGIVIKKIPIVDGGLDVDIEKMAYEFSKEKPKAVICTHISNVTGYILPIAKIFEEAKKYGAITVLDTAQSLGLVPVDIRTIRADIIAFAGHKTLYGPFGIGGFLNITGVSLEETIVGGTGSDSLNLNMPAGAEARYESSSTNINAIAGLNAALEVLNPPLLLEKEKELSNYLKKELEELSNIKIYLPKEEQDHVGIFSITVDEYLADDVGTILDDKYD